MMVLLSHAIRQGALETMGVPPSIHLCIFIYFVCPFSWFPAIISSALPWQAELIWWGGMMSSSSSSSLSSSSPSVNFCFKLLLLQNYLPDRFQTLHNDGEKMAPNSMERFPNFLFNHSLYCSYIGTVNSSGKTFRHDYHHAPVLFRLD